MFLLMPRLPRMFMNLPRFSRFRVMPRFPRLRFWFLEGSGYLSVGVCLMWFGHFVFRVLSEVYGMKWQKCRWKRWRGRRECDEDEEWFQRVWVFDLCEKWKMNDNGLYIYAKWQTMLWIMMTLHWKYAPFVGKRKYSNWNVAPLRHVSLHNVRRGTVFGGRRWNVFWGDVSFLFSDIGASGCLESSPRASKRASGSGFASGRA